MSEQSPFVELGQTYQRAFDEVTPASMPRAKGEAFTEWLSAHPEYVPSFGERMGAAVKWVEQNPENFQTLLQEFDATIDFLNNSTDTLDEKIFTNIVDYRKHRGTAPLPTLEEVTATTSHNKWPVLRAIVDSAHKVHWGETIRPEDGDFYSYHKFVKSDKGMVAASMVDLYENYIRSIGQYPTDTAIDALIANAITEAAFITNPTGQLFETLKNPDDEWIYGYDGFSPEFQQAVYEVSP